MTVFYQLRNIVFGIFDVVEDQITYYGHFMQKTRAQCHYFFLRLYNQFLFIFTVLGMTNCHAPTQILLIATCFQLPLRSKPLLHLHTQTINQDFKASHQQTRVSREIWPSATLVSFGLFLLFIIFKSLQDFLLASVWSLTSIIFSVMFGAVTGHQAQVQV